MAHFKKQTTLKQLLIILTFVLTSLTLFGQTFVGYSTDKMNSYNCRFRINKDSTINFIYDRDKNGIYAEHFGIIRRTNDTLFHISATMTFGQFYMKSPYYDTLTIQTDSILTTEIAKLRIHFASGQTKELKDFNSKWFKYCAFNWPIDKRLFNSKKGTDYVYITISRKNPITDELLKFNIPFGSAASFTSGQKEEFDVVIKNGNLRTVGKAPIQTGHLKLIEKMD